MNKTYGTYYPETFLRSYAPGFKRLGHPTPVADTSSPQHLREHKYEIAKTKAEVVGEYHYVMTKVSERVVKSVFGLLASGYCALQAMAGGGQMFALGFLGFLGLAVYWWWHAGAAYSNWQEFEMRPVLMPIENAAAEQAGAK
ncbi:MAG: hypothetical protein V1834_00995 [Candidatus Micrarchaeota archaeon]